MKSMDIFMKSWLIFNEVSFFDACCFFSHHAPKKERVSFLYN